MSVQDQQKFMEALQKLVDYYSSEFHLTYGEIISSLEIEKTCLIIDLYKKELNGELDDEEEDEEEKGNFGGISG